MKIFSLPQNTWLPVKGFEALIHEHEQHWKTVESSAIRPIPYIYMNAQNQAMLLKFFLEQAFGAGAPVGKTLRIIERDFDGISALASVWLSEASKDEVDWIVLGLSFADFRFHLFPIGTHGQAIPFCISPIMCTCLRSDIIALSNMSRKDFAKAQWEHINWQVVELRIACLEKPLDVLEDAQDCVEDTCKTEIVEST